MENGLVRRCKYSQLSAVGKMQRRHGCGASVALRCIVGCPEKTLWRSGLSAALAFLLFAEHLLLLALGFFETGHEA